ncbi:histone-lysine N-methyltransferase SETMAR [Trichonephila clavipes]|nr:histone-lysine N-methyltransferase SETMAR [Trichonephila clavipes]
MSVLIENSAACEIRCVIRFLNAKKVKPIEIYRQICEVYGQNAMRDSMVRRWVRQFNEGRSEVLDEERSRRVPKILTESHKIKRMGCALEFLTRYHEDGVDFLSQIVTGDETWVSYDTPESQTINAAVYCETLRKLRRAIQNKRRGFLSKGVVFLHDNARPHIANVTKTLLRGFGWDVFDHPPYSPDLTPSDFHLFLHLKCFLAGGRTRAGVTFCISVALKEDLIRVVEDLDGTVESTDTIVKLKTKIENSSTFESDPDFIKTLIQNCIDERVSRNEREVTLEKQKIELAKLQLAQLEKEIELQRAKNKAVSLNPATKVGEKQFKTLNKETATHIGIREAEDWFRPIDLAKECDIYISSKNGSRKETPITYGYTQDPFKNRSQNFKPKIKENYPQYLERENKNCFICGDSSHYARDCEMCFKPKESNSHIHNRINVNTLKVESEKQNSDEFSNLQYVNIFVENQPVTALIDSGCQIPVLNSSLIRVNKPSEEIITLSSCFSEQRMVEVKPINISLNQHSPGLSVRTAISPTLTEEFIIHPSVHAEVKKLDHAKSDVLLSESGSSLSTDSGVSFPNVSVSNVIENSSYDLSHVKNFNTRNDLSYLIKDYKCNKIESTKLKLSIIREKCSDIVLCKKVNGAMKTSSVNFNAPSPMESKYRRFTMLRKIFEPWQWKRRKKRNRFEQTSRTLERKISMRSTKDQLIKKDVLMPVKHNVCVFLWNFPDVEEMPSHDGETV